MRLYHSIQLECHDDFKCSLDAAEGGLPLSAICYSQLLLQMIFEFDSSLHISIDFEKLRAVLGDVLAA